MQVWCEKESTDQEELKVMTPHANQDQQQRGHCQDEIVVGDTVKKAVNNTTLPLFKLKAYSTCATYNS